MRSFATLLIVGGLLTIAATFSVGGPRLLTDEVASTIRGADLITNASCQVAGDCNDWNEAKFIISNSDCAGGEDSDCSVCDNGPLPIRGCQIDPTSNCERVWGGTNCGNKMTGKCENGICSDTAVDGSCDDGPNCYDV